MIAEGSSNVKNCIKQGYISEKKNSSVIMIINTIYETNLFKMSAEIHLKFAMLWIIILSYSPIAFPGPDSKMQIHD